MKTGNRGNDTAGIDSAKHIDVVLISQSWLTVFPGLNYFGDRPNFKKKGGQFPLYRDWKMMLSAMNIHKVFLCPH